MIIINCENLTHIYPGRQDSVGDVVALNNINLKINKGEFVALLGGNGSGKSTLAKHFNALLLPTTGKCYVNGWDTSDHKRVWEVRGTCGMVFQNPDNQIVAAIVEEDVAFGPENLGIESNEIKLRVFEALAAVGMEEYRKHAPHLLSGGQKQRVAIAGALAIDAQCLVLDEPTAMLDPGGRYDVMKTLLKLNKNNNKTIVLITHFMEEALLADRVVVMKEGEIILDGTPDCVFAETEKLLDAGLEVPLAAQVADFFRENMIEIPSGIVRDNELLEFICR
ncbi:MAG: energy-coupling factor transporter ATPase [Negativicutes bacterium]|jgi:energy-coupling factor transport system ATP-binding protein